MAVRPPDGQLSLAACLRRHRQVGGELSLAVVATVDSTNRLARRIVDAYLSEDRPVPRLALLAREQTAGRGRRGRPWISPPGQGIYTSLLLAVADADALAALPLEVPLAICRELDHVGVSCGIKWPNDLVAGGRKLGGVLIEAPAGPRAVIVGYGINGCQEEADLPSPEATSLRLEAGVAPDLSRLAVDLAVAVAARLEKSEPLATLVEAYGARSVHRPGDRLVCRVGEGTVTGSFGGFDERGRLRLATEEGDRVLAAAELVSADEAASAAAGGGGSGP